MREIDSLREERDGLDLALRFSELRLSAPHKPCIRFTIRDLDNRLDGLRLRQNMLYNGYLQLYRDGARRP